MSIVEAIFLGIIQGVTEFLPVSSSGHLVLIPNLLNMAQPTLAFITIVHLGTLLAVLIYFWHDIISIVKAFVSNLAQGQPFATAESRLGWFVIIGSIPAAIVGLSLADTFERIFSSPLAPAVFLFITAGLLVAGERLLTGQKQLEHMTWFDALLIGLFQAFALLPGVSRSGSTITAGLWRGVDRALAARYSFLLGIPPILGAGLLYSLKLSGEGNIGTQIPFLAAAFVAAAVSGYACIHFLLSWLRQHNLYIFAVYCAVFGSINLLFIWLA